MKQLISSGRRANLNREPLEEENSLSSFQCGGVFGRNGMKDGLKIRSAIWGIVSCCPIYTNGLDHVLCLNHFLFLFFWLFLFYFIFFIVAKFIFFSNEGITFCL